MNFQLLFDFMIVDGGAITVVRTIDLPEVGGKWHSPRAEKSVHQGAYRRAWQI